MTNGKDILHIRMKKRALGIGNSSDWNFSNGFPVTIDESFKGTPVSVKDLADGIVENAKMECNNENILPWLDPNSGCSGGKVDCSKF
jgi:hypothetical protein